MKKVITNDLIQINIVMALFVLVISLFPTNNILRIILGIPFILFFPGYVVTSALFPRRNSLDGIERVALSFGLSIAITPLIGIILNYTQWGIALYPLIISQGIFIVIVSVIAWYKRKRLHEEENFSIRLKLNFSDWKGQSRPSRILSIALVISLVGATGVLSYFIANPTSGEKFTEFYLLGIEGKTDGYPRDFIISRGETVAVIYAYSNNITSKKQENTGRLIIGIVNHEQEQANYQVEIKIDGISTNIWMDGQWLDKIGPITLAHEEKWEQEIGFAPDHTGDNQKVEFILYKDGQFYFDDPPHLWIDVTE